MNLYNLLFGMNAQTDLLLAVLGLRQNDVERFRDVSIAEGGKQIVIYTRTGGGNRSDYQNLTMRKLPTWRGSVDDGFDNTYCTDTFDVPSEWTQDVANLSDILAHGMRAEFAQHLAKTIRREPTEADKETAAYEEERSTLARVSHVKANGHTFVPHDDRAMESALKLAEANNGKLRSCWGILPIALTVKRDFHPCPQAVAERDRAYLVRVEVGYDYKWVIDEAYWAHCQKRWQAEYPVTMAVIADSVETHLQKSREKP